MSLRQTMMAAALICMLAIVAAGQAHAICVIQAGSISASPGSVNTGTYTAPTSSPAVAINITVSGTYFAFFGGTCTVAVAFNRASLPAVMAQGGGSATLPYQITSSSGGGNSLIYTSGIPSASNRLTSSFPALGFLTLNSFSLNFTAYARMLPAVNQAGGSYLDGITLDVFNLSTGGGSLMLSQAFSVTGTVNRSCTIGGLANPAADSVTLPVSAAGAVVPAAISRSYGSVVCNYPSTVQLTSLNGGVRNSGSAPAGFGRIINYTSTAVFSGASATVNTASVPGANGPESGTAVATSGATPAGTLFVTILPQANTQPLIAGGYADTLRITIAPQ